MEVKATLFKPYTDKEKDDFIVIQNHQLSRTIRELEDRIEALEYSAEEQQELNRGYIQSLFMTRADFFDGTIKAFGATEEKLIIAISNILNLLQMDETEKLVAMNAFKNALNFYRKHPLFDILSNVPIKIDEQTICITSDQWDRYFIDTFNKVPNAYIDLLPVEEPEEPST